MLLSYCALTLHNIITAQYTLFTSHTVHGAFSFICCHRILVYENTHTAVLRPQDHLGELVPEEIFYSLWCKGR